MRNSFFASLLELAKKDRSIIVMTADMGFSVLEPFRDGLPAQYINSGISEANTASMAAGMALMGKKVYAYSIVPFITYRCLEQIRVDVCCQGADVKLVGVGGGLDYAQSGSTHQSTEDISIMRSLPNMSVVCPEDPLEAAALPAVLDRMGSPAYVRLGRGKEATLHKAPVTMEPGRSFELLPSDGRNRVSVFATGNITHNTLQAVERLRAGGMDAKLTGMPWIKPLDGSAVLREAAESRLLVTVEEHSTVGGLRSAVADLLCEAGARTSLKSIALPDAFQKSVGDQAYLRKLNGLDPQSMERSIAAWSRT